MNSMHRLEYARSSHVCITTLWLRGFDTVIGRTTPVRLISLASLTQHTKSCGRPKRAARKLQTFQRYNEIQLIGTINQLKWNCHFGIKQNNNFSFVCVFVCNCMVCMPKSMHSILIVLCNRQTTQAILEKLKQQHNLRTNKLNCITMLSRLLWLFIVVVCQHIRTAFKVLAQSEFAHGLN